MDLCADMLVRHAPADTHFEVCQPAYQKRFGWLPGKRFENFDRWRNRWKVYPLFLKKLPPRDGFYHLVDHSYAHLLHYLPEGKVGVYCHDLDAFRSVLQPHQEARPAWYRKMMGRVFEGFKKARIVFCNTHSTRISVLSLGIWNESEVILAPLGLAEEYSPQGERERGEYLLHVGSCIPRKRIDVLIKIFAKLSKKYHNLKLIQAGGIFTNDQSCLIKQLKIESKVEQRSNLSRYELAKLYRGAKCLLVTSEVEGFGLPVIEALSCGTMVVASDIPALREAGRNFAKYCFVGSIDDWSDTIGEVLESKPNVNLKIQEIISQEYSWERHSKIILSTYQKIMEVGK